GLTRLSDTALEERRRREGEERAARATVTRAKQTFAAGHWDEAIETLEHFTPPHEAVETALNELRAERTTRQREARESEERRRREEAEAEQRRHAQQRWVTRPL